MRRVESALYPAHMVDVRAPVSLTRSVFYFDIHFRHALTPMILALDSLSYSLSLLVPLLVCGVLAPDCT